MRVTMLGAALLAIYAVAYQELDQIDTAQTVCVTAFAIACALGAAFGRSDS